MLGEWYQKTHKTEDTNKVTLLAFKIIAILHNYMVGNVYKASGNFMNVANRVVVKDGDYFEGQ
jgi:hypothetical protein